MTGKSPNMNYDLFRSITADEIIRLLEEPTTDRRPLKTLLQRQAPAKQLIEALRISKQELTRRILCDILATRKAKLAVLVLLQCLDDPSMKVRDNAAEALGKIGSLKAGEALLNHFIDDQRAWYAAALGALKYRPAIPFLIDAISSSIGEVRGSSAWSLGEMQVQEVENELEIALKDEKNTYAYERIKEALEKIKAENDNSKIPS